MSCADNEALELPTTDGNREPFIKAAAEAYEYALVKLGDVESDADHNKQIVPLCTALQLNMANIYWELQDYKMTVSHCDAVVSHEHALNLLPLSAFRAHYRRGMALHALEESEKALADLVLARAMKPGDRRLHELCKEVMEGLGKEDCVGWYEVIQPASVRDSP